MALLEQDLDSRSLPPMELRRFNGKPSHRSEFIQSLKSDCTRKKQFRMERLLFVFDSEAKQVVSSIGKNCIFYASALTVLKNEFGNPYQMAYLDQG